MAPIAKCLKLSIVRDTCCLSGQKQQAPLKLSEENSLSLLHEVSLQCSIAPNCSKFSVALTARHSSRTSGHLAKKSPSSLYFRPTEQRQKQHKLSWGFPSKRNEGKNKAISFKLSLKNSTKHYVLVFGGVFFLLVVCCAFFSGKTQATAFLTPWMTINHDKLLSKTCGSHLQNIQTQSHCSTASAPHC